MLATYTEGGASERISLEPLDLGQVPLKKWEIPPRRAGFNGTFEAALAAAAILPLPCTDRIPTGLRFARCRVEAAREAVGQGT